MKDGVSDLGNFPANWTAAHAVPKNYATNQLTDLHVRKAPRNSALWKGTGSQIQIPLERVLNKEAHAQGKWALNQFV